MKESLRDRVYRELLDKIISCEFEPNSFITEDRLIEISGTSRTPVREALHKLEEDRFVKIFPKRGIYISEITPRSLREVFEIRIITEPFIIRTYGFRIPGEKANDMLSAADAVTENGADGPETEKELMELLLNACANEHLKALARIMFCHSVRIRIGSGLAAAENGAQAYREDAKLLRLIASREYDEAAALRAEMLEKEEQAVLSAMFKTDRKDPRGKGL